MKKLLLTFASFVAINAHAQDLHGDLETWRNFYVSTVPDSTFQAPMYWNTPDSITFLALSYYTSATFTKQLIQSADAHSGSLAARLTTWKEDTLGVFPGLMTNADIALNMAAFMSGDMSNVLSMSGGTPVTSRTPAVSAWVKYYPSGTDTAFLRVEAIRSLASASGADSIIGYGYARITELTTAYTQITANINYTDPTSVPDLLRVYISSSGRAPQIGSELLVDDININTTSVPDVEHNTNYTAFPVPAKDHISFNSVVKGRFSVTIFAADGSYKASYSALPGEQINVSNLPQGVYYYNVNNSEGASERGTFVLTK